MKLPLLITGDVAAMSGIFAGLLHVLPAIEGAVATGLGGLYYAILLYDRIIKKRHDL